MAQGSNDPQIYPDRPSIPRSATSKFYEPHLVKDVKDNAREANASSQNIRRSPVWTIFAAVNKISIDLRRPLPAMKRNFCGANNSFGISRKFAKDNEGGSQV